MNIRILLLFVVLIFSSLFTYSQDIEKLKQKAEKGNDKAKVELSIHYIRNGTDSEKRKVYSLLKGLYFSNNDYNSMRDYCLAVCYYNGWGVDPNYIKAFEIFENLCILGFDNYFPDAEFYKGCCELNGLGTPISKGAAYRSFYHSALHGSHKSRFALGEMVVDGELVEKTRLETIFHWIKELADIYLTDPKVQYMLGYLYHYGLGTDANEQKAITCYKKSNTQKAKTQLAMLELEIPIIIDKSVNIQYNRPFEGDANCIMVNKSGKVIASYNLEKEKISNYSGDDEILMDFANYFYTTNNYNIKYPKRKAFKLYLQLASQNNSTAQFMVGRMYQFGYGIEKNEYNAIQWYQKSNNPSAQKMLALLGDLVAKKNSPISVDNKQQTGTQNNSEKRIAFLIGNSKYNEKTNGPTPLICPENDVTDMKKKLKELGFITVPRTNLDKDQMQSDIHNFCDTISKKYDVVLFYYSGHAVQYKGDSKLLPVNEDFNYAAEYKKNTVDLSFILEELNNTKINTRIVILDACRNRGIGSKGFGDDEWVMPANPGCFLAFATRAGSEAGDGRIGVDRNSIYTKVLLETLEEPSPIGVVFEHITSKVEQMTDREQMPRHYNDLSGPYRQFHFNVKSE